MAAGNRRFSTKDDLDKGYAWVILVAGFFLIAFEVGNSSIQGIFFIEFLEYFQAKKVDISIIFTLIILFFGLSGFFLGPVVVRCGERHVAIFGSILASVSLIVPSFLPHLTVTYIFLGIGIGVASGCQCIAAVCIIMTYFNKRLSMAIAIQSCGFCVGGFVFPLIANALIEAYSWRGALFVLGGLHLNTVVCSILFRSMGPVAMATDNITRTSFPEKVRRFLKECFDLTIMKNKRLLVHFISLAILYAGECVPWVYLPSRGITTGVDKRKAALLVAMMGLSSTFVRPFVGFLGDAMKNYKPVFMAFGSILAGVQFVVSYFFLSYWSLVVMALLQGMLSAVYMVLIRAIIPDVSPPDRVPHAVGFAMLLLGLASLISTPVAGALVDRTGNFVIVFVVFGFVMIFGGSLSFLTFYLQRKYLKTLTNHG